MNDPANKSTLSLAAAVQAAERHFEASEWAAAQFIYAQLTSAQVVTRLYERLIECLQRQKKFEEAVEAYVAWLKTEADPMPAEFDATYLAALRATRNTILPLRRRRRFRLLGDWFTETADIEGAIAECGCFRGLSAHFLCSLERNRSPGYDGTGFHIFDSFAGLSFPSDEDRITDNMENADRLREMCVPGAFAAPLELVRDHLQEFPGIAFHQGWIPDAFDDLPEMRYRFVNLDVDLYEPTHESLEYFYPRLAPGGVIVSDDYSWPGACRAIDAFAERQSIPVETNPLGQAVLRKPK